MRCPPVRVSVPASPPISRSGPRPSTEWAGSARAYRRTGTSFKASAGDPPSLERASEDLVATHSAAAPMTVEGRSAEASAKADTGRYKRPDDPPPGATYAHWYALPAGGPPGRVFRPVSPRFKVLPTT